MKINRRVSKDNIDRDKQIVMDYNAEIPMLDLVLKYKLSQARIYQIIKEHEEQNGLS